MADDKGAAAVLTREFVPTEYHDRPYLKDWLDKPWDKAVGAEVFKKLNGAEELIGKRPPANPDPKTAKPEDLIKFFESYAEEKPEGYEIPLEKDAKVDPEFIKAVQAGFHAGKISKVQAQGMMKTVEAWAQKSRAAAAQAQAKKDAEFDALAKTMLGEQSKDVMTLVKKTIKDLAPQAAQANLDKIDDNNLVVMAAVIHSIIKKYVSEDDLKKGSGGAGAGANTAAEKTAEMMKIMGEPAFSKPFDVGHDAAVARVRVLAKEIDALGG